MVCIGAARSRRPASLHCDCSIKKYSKRNNLRCNYLNVNYLILFLKTEEKLASRMKAAYIAVPAGSVSHTNLLLLRKFHWLEGVADGIGPALALPPNVAQNHRIQPE
jgi:hypothetical protein